MNPILSMSMWTSLSSEQRNRIRALFKIPRSRSVEVHDGHIVTDGTTPEDFKALTIGKMQDYLRDESTDFHKLFDKVIARVQDEIEGKPLIGEPVAPQVEINNAKPKKNVKKNNQEAGK